MRFSAEDQRSFFKGMFLDQHRWFLMRKAWHDCCRQGKPVFPDFRKKGLRRRFDVDPFVRADQRAVGLVHKPFGLHSADHRDPTHLHCGLPERLQRDPAQ